MLRTWLGIGDLRAPRRRSAFGTATLRKRAFGTTPRRRALGATAAACAVALLVGAGPVAPSTADTLDDLEAQQDALRAQQQQYQAQREQVAAALEGTNAALSETYLALQDINARLPIAQAELETANVTLAAKERESQAIADRLAVAEQQQGTLTQEIADSESEEARVRAAIGQLARSTYRDGVDLSALAVVLEATTPEQFADRYSAMDTARRTQTQALTDLENSLAVQRNAQVRLEAVQERIAELQAEAEAAVAAAEEARNEAAARAAEIQRLQAEAAEKAATLESQRSEYQTQQSEIDADNQAVASQIEALAQAEAAERARIAEEERQRQEAARAAEEQRRREAAAAAAGGNSGGGSGSASSGGAASGSSGSSESSSGSSTTTSSLLVPPVPRPLHVTSPYGYRVYPITGGWFMHKGVDLRSACGNPQVAAAAGTVVKIGYAASNGTHGNQVIINHGVLGGKSTVTVYNHLSRFAVSNGQRVAQGQVIGYTGATGNVTGCHVHFELWFNGSTVNPMDYL